VLVRLVETQISIHVNAGIRLVVSIGVVSQQNSVTLPDKHFVENNFCLTTLRQLQPPPDYVVHPVCQANVQLNVYATGFDANGNITGEIYPPYACGSMRGGIKRYPHWDSIVRDAAGNFITLAPYDGVVPETYSTDQEQLPFTPHRCWADALYTDGASTLFVASGCASLTGNGYHAILRVQ
jgi:hypothetical protein